MTIPAIPRGQPTGIWWRLLGAAALFFGAAGLLLWWREGEAVFAHYLLAAAAWCF